jgi:hypothetical protein
MQPFSKIAGTLALAVLFATLAGCSEYLDRRDNIALSGGNSVASNEVTHMVDPWPRDSANREIAYNGDKMQTAVERYRTNKVIPPVGTGTSTSYQAPGAPAAAAVAPTAPPQAPVK